MAKKNAAKNSHKDTLIGVGAILEGTFDIEYNVHVDGVLRGERLATRQALTVGPEGEVQADCIEVAEAFIDGQVDGLLKASECVYFKAGARFKGTLQTPKLVIEEGALLEEGQGKPEQVEQAAKASKRH